MRQEQGGWAARTAVSLAVVSAGVAPAILPGESGQKAKRTRRGVTPQLRLGFHVGDSHLIWGEGLNWDSPGSIWYSRGR